MVLAVSQTGEATIAGDRNLLFQALANLLDNAIKFSAGAEGPTRRHLEISFQRDGNIARFVVSDHGPGIPAESRDRVTEPFFRLESSRSTPGSGIGLSLVAAVAKLHDGRLVLSDNHPGLRAELVISVGG
jgi:signal transduction histidine kinase